METIPESQLVLMPAVAAQHLMHIFRIQALFLRQRLDDFPVLIIPVQQVSQAFPQFSSAAAKLPAYCDNLHFYVPLSC